MDTNITPIVESSPAPETRMGLGRLKRRPPQPSLGSMAMNPRFAWRGVAEAAVLIAAMIALNGLFGSGHRFLGVEPHPFGLAVLLVAAQYGTAEAAAVTILASAALLAFNVPEQQLDQSRNDWLLGIVRDPLIWLTISLIVGEISGRMRQRARQSANLAIRREGELAAMVQANTELVTRVTALETRIAGQQRTVTSIYEAARGLGPGREAVLNGALALVRAAIGATRTSVYLLQGNALVPAGGDGWQRTESQPAISSDADVFHALIGERRCLLVNNPADREVLGESGLMAAPLLTTDGAVLGALVVEEIPFTQLHLGAVANFRSVCAWVGDGLEKASRYDSAQEGRFLVEGSSLVAASQADRLIGIMGATARRIGFSLTLMQLDLEHELAENAEARRTLITVMEAVLRDTDLLIQGEQHNRLRVLMPGTPLRNGPLVAERLRTALAGQNSSLRNGVSITWLSLNERSEKELVA